MEQWPRHKRLTDDQYSSLFPPCWQEDPKHGMGRWVKCKQCRAHFGKLGHGGMPSRWVCRCGLHDTYWRHQEIPHDDTTCRPCEELMAAEGIDLDRWSKCARESGRNSRAWKAVGKWLHVPSWTLPSDQAAEYDRTSTEPGTSSLPAPGSTSASSLGPGQRPARECPTVAV